MIIKSTFKASTSAIYPRFPYNYCVRCLKKQDMIQMLPVDQLKTPSYNTDSTQLGNGNNDIGVKIR